MTGKETVSVLVEMKKNPNFGQWEVVATSETHRNPSIPETTTEFHPIMHTQDARTQAFDGSLVAHKHKREIL